MENRSFRNYWLLACGCVLLASVYPLMMGVRVVADMLIQGSVLKENYPKYIIPYTPISLALLLGALLMPLWFRWLKKYALAGASVLSVGAFFGFELLLERLVVVTSQEIVTKATLEDWQMYMCWVPAEGTVLNKVETAVQILMGEYNPAFKLHFYVISLVLILSLLNCLYGFGQMVRTGDTRRKKALILQTVSALAFLGLCILACFTAFWRDGSLEVSPLSAFLMTLFFLLFGITAGIFTGSLLLEKGRLRRIRLSALAASEMTLVMYVGELILLHGHLYSLGEGFLFKGLPGIVLSPFDLMTVLASGLITAGIFRLLQEKTQ